MLHKIMSIALLAARLFSLTLIAAAQNNPVVIMKTSKGDITIELYQAKAPISVKNFLSYAMRNFTTGRFSTGSSRDS